MPHISVLFDGWPVLLFCARKEDWLIVLKDDSVFCSIDAGLFDPRCDARYFWYRANGLCLIAFHTDDLVQDKERNALRIW